jgi:serine/threonine protein kinase
LSLAAGTRLGPYEIHALLGAGGMGEVYRARDTTLGRDVAIKVVSDPFVNDAERLARFQREAQVLASLNHPNIGGIYGLENVEGMRALVLELVEGPTLADRLAQGVLPLDVALPIARQITEALAVAHRQGIVHRDLKPANIKLRADGTVKVLDFGLAKLAEPVGGAPQRGALAISNSPTNDDRLTLRSSHSDFCVLAVLRTRHWRCGCSGSELRGDSCCEDRCIRRIAGPIVALKKS